ncbi:MAG: transposase [Thermodesulfobacteriota bacterium]|nr:transposase [Thermodesulfobacteriota bacterium]
MVDFQIPLPGLARGFNDLTKEEREFVEYFSIIDSNSISPVVDCYAGIGPQGYGTALVLARIVKVKERILSDRQLAKVLKQNDLYRFVTYDAQPSHNTFNTLRKRLGTKGFVEIHKRFVSKAQKLELLDPEIIELPKNRKKGIILVADSTFLITAGSTRGQKDEQGKWHFNDESVAFSGKGHHSHKYPVGHKVHSLRTISGIPLVTLLTPANESDQAVIMLLIEELVSRYPCLKFAYIILDRGYDAEEIHHDIYEFFGIIPIIIRKKMVYPKGFTEDGYPLCPWGFVMKQKGVDYKRKRTRYACFKVCKKSEQLPLFSCNYIKEQYKYGYSRYVYFSDGYRKYGPAVPHSMIYKKLKPFRTGIERTFGLVKENRYRMEMSNFYKGIDNVTIHAIEHDIVLTLDIIYDYIKTGKISPVLNLNY